MNKWIGIILLILVSSGVGFAQRGGGAPGGGQRLERIHAAKMAYVVDKLRLTADQMVAFMPLYREYESDIRETRIAFYKKNKGVDFSATDDATARKFIDDDLDYQQQIIAIKRRYNDRFLKVITPQQLAELSTAEREFKQILTEKLKDRPAGGRGGWRR